jgi:hypothetical protein
MLNEVSLNKNKHEADYVLVNKNVIKGSQEPKPLFLPEAIVSILTQCCDNFIEHNYLEK